MTKGGIGQFCLQTTFTAAIIVTSIYVVPVPLYHRPLFYPHPLPRIGTAGPAKPTAPATMWKTSRDGFKMAASKESRTQPGKGKLETGKGNCQPLPIGFHTFPHTNTVRSSSERVKGKGGHYPHLQAPGTIGDTGYSEGHSGAHIPK